MIKGINLKEFYYSHHFLNHLLQRTDSQNSKHNVHNTTVSYLSFNKFDFLLNIHYRYSFWANGLQLFHIRTAPIPSWQVVFVPYWPIYVS